MTLNPITSIKSYFAKKRAERNIRDNNWIDKLSTLGFNQVTFPIIIKNGIDIKVICQLQEFAIDPDYYYWELDSKAELIDSNGKLWSWKYDYSNKTNYPNKIEKTLTIEEIKKIIKISVSYKNSKIQYEIEDITNKEISIDKLLNEISDKL